MFLHCAEVWGTAKAESISILSEVTKLICTASQKVCLSTFHEILGRTCCLFNVQKPETSQFCKFLLYPTKKTLLNSKPKSRSSQVLQLTTRYKLFCWGLATQTLRDRYTHVYVYGRRSYTSFVHVYYGFYQFVVRKQSILLLCYIITGARASTVGYYKPLRMTKLYHFPLQNVDFTDLDTNRIRDKA